MKWYLQWLAMSVLLFAYIPLEAQQTCTYSISGKLLGREHEEAVCFADVVIRETGKGAVTDADGFYRLEGVCPGTYTLVCQHIGFVPQEITVTVINKNVHQSFYLESSVNHLHEALVQGHTDQKMTVQSSVELDEHDLDKMKGLTLGEGLKRISGVTTLNTGNTIAKPMIHGLHSKRLLIMNNGVRQEGQQWGSEHGPEIDPFMAKKITVIKGANGVRYGSDAIGGVVLVDPAPLVCPLPLRGEVNLVGQLNGYSGAASGTLEGYMHPRVPLTWRVQGTYRRAGDLKAPDYFLTNTGVEEYTVSAGLGYIKQKFGIEVYYSFFNTKIAILEASHFGNITDLEQAIASPRPLVIRDFSYAIGRPYQLIRHQMVKGKGYVRTGSVGKLEFTVAFQDNNRQEFDKHKPFNDSLAALNKPALQFILQTITADIGWNHTIGKKVNGIVGISGLYQTNRWYGAYLIPSFRNVNGGLYWIERYKPVEWLELEGGVRFDYNYLQVYKYQNNVLTKPDYHFYNVAGNVGAVVHAHSNVHIRFNYGSSWRPPHVSELYSNGVHHGAATFEIGDPNLRPERAHNFNLTVNYSSKRIRAEVTAYYYYMQDFIYLQPVQPPTLTIRGAFPTFAFRQGNTDIKGVDADLEVDLTEHLVLGGKMMMLWSWNYTLNDWQVLMPSNRYDASLTYNFSDRRWIKTPYMSIAMQYVDKQWNAPQSGDYAPPPGAYMLFGLEAGCSFMIRGQQLDVSLAVTNLLDTPYRDYLNRFRYFADEAGRNVVLRLKWPFQIDPMKSKNK